MIFDNYDNSKKEDISQITTPCEKIFICKTINNNNN